MRFNFPFGLLLLIAIPVLIIIYIIKNRYKEKVVSSEYIWELSKKFLKKKNPLSSIANLLNLIIQCLCIGFLSFSLADPVFTFKNGAENEVYILDASASMGIENENGTTRFEKAKEEIKTLVDDSTNGSTYTLVVGDSNARTICKNIEDKEIFISMLDRVQIDYAESSLENAIGLAQSLSSTEEGSHFTLFTDKEVKNIDGFTSFNVSDTNKNYSVSDLRINNIKEEDIPYVLLEADIFSYSDDATLNVEFFFDETSVGKVEQAVKQNEKTVVSLKLQNTGDQYSNYNSIKATIQNDDYLKDDSEFIVYNVDDIDATKVLIVSKAPFFFEAVFRALNRNDTKILFETMSPVLYSIGGVAMGYDVVIFDSFAPKSLPVDSAVWLFNCNESIPNSGFYFQKEFTVEDPGIKASYPENNDDLVYQALTRDLTKREITIKTYLRYTFISKFSTILSYDNLPFIFAGRNGFNQKQVVFNFDIHNSNLPLLADFVTLIRNCLGYSNPNILDEFNYDVTENVVFNFPDTAINCEILTPSNKKEYVSSTDIQTYKLKEVGSYEIKVELATGKVRKLKIYSAFPQGERVPFVEDINKYSISLKEDAHKADRVFEALLVVVIIALVFLLADWMLYSHEQF